MSPVTLAFAPSRLVFRDRAGGESPEAALDFAPSHRQSAYTAPFARHPGVARAQVGVVLDAEQAAKRVSVSNFSNTETKCRLAASLSVGSCILMQRFIAVPRLGHPADRAGGD